MDGILALGHFCETHGPCVILCTQRCQEKPTQGPHSLTVPWCEACQSIELHQALMSRDCKGQYITTRTPLQQDLAFLLKQATVRSLSCEEETNKEGGILYFGDNERGHVFSHTFTLQDSLARGFHRRYCILMLMRDKIHLLNSWPFLVKHVKRIAEDLQTQAASVNVLEQEKQSQRSVRQAQGSPASPARSLSQLTGQPAVFAHLHLWFCWLFSTEVTVEKPPPAISFNPPEPVVFLRALYFDMGPEVFKIAAYCVLIGYKISCDDAEVLKSFKSLLPAEWPPRDEKVCRLYREAKWLCEWSGEVPVKFPTLITLAEKFIEDSNLPDSVLKYQLSALVLRWRNNVNAISWCPVLEPPFLQSLDVQTCDVGLIEYFLYCIVNNADKCKSIVENLKKGLSR